MSRAIVSTRVARRRIPTIVPGDANLWTWDPLRRRKAESRLVVRWMLLAIVGIAAFVVFRILGVDVPQAPREDGILWLDEPPPAPVEESRAIPPPPEPEADAARPLPLDPSPQPLAVVDPDPAFGTDDALESGGLAVATGSTLAKAPDSVVREPGPPSDPVLLESVPGSTNSVVPRYPPRAEAMGLESKVVALVTTDSLGSVVGFRIERSGGREFDESVRAAALSTRYVVPVREGRRRAVAFRLPYTFRLE